MRLTRGAAFAAGAALAVMTGIEVMTGTGAKAQEIRQIDIPAQPLGSALVELSRETGLDVIASNGLTDGVSTAGIAGAMTARAALDALLAGTDLRAQPLDTNRVVIAQAGPAADLGSGPLLMDELLVQGELQTRSLQDTQTSVAVITGEELETRSDTSLRSVAERTAG
ncbi:MAG: hypothetical protein AAFX62_06545, partial [Pseudomonadota bacterium]